MRTKRGKGRKTERRQEKEKVNDVRRIFTFENVEDSVKREKKASVYLFFLFIISHGA